MDDGSGGPAATRRAGGAIELVSQATTASGRPRFAVQDPPGREYELLARYSQAKYRAATFDDMAVKADRIKANRFTAIDGDGARHEVRRTEGRWAVPAPPRWIEPPTGPGVVQLGARPSTAAERAQTAESARLRSELHAQFGMHRSVEVAVSGSTGRVAGETTYRLHGGAGSFTESTRRIDTDSGTTAVIRAMVDVAQVRGWTAQRVEGSEDFKRQVWLESTARGIKTLGYEPKPWDLEMLDQARAERAQGDRPGPVAAPDTRAVPRVATKRTMLAAVEAVLVERQMPAAERQAVLAAAADRLTAREAAGHRFELKVDGRMPAAASPVTPAHADPGGPSRGR